MPGGFSQERHAGAGRTLDIAFPDFDDYGVNGTAYPLAAGSRGRGGAARTGLNYAQSQTVTGTGTVTYATGDGWNGRGGVLLFPGAAGFAKLTPGWAMNPALGAAAVNGYLNDPYSCFRTLAVLSFNIGNAVAGVRETGWVWQAHNVGTETLRGGAAGFGFIQTGADEISFARRAGVGGGGGLLTTVPVLQAAEILDWHVYEIRIIGATPTKNAQVKAFIDGRQVNLQGVNGSTLDWIADGLPTPRASNGIYGFRAAFNADGQAAANTGMVLHRTFLQAAPNEVNLL